MKKYLQKIPIILSFYLFVLTTILSLQAQDKDPFVYVWDFVKTDSLEKELAAKFTDEFETAFTQSRYFEVLERRNYDRLIAHKDLEKEIMKLEAISTATIDSLKFHRAKAIIFGEISDDIQSGEIKVTITFQSFDSKKKKWSIRFSRGKRFDAESREKKMDELVKKLDENYLRKSSINKNHFKNGNGKELEERENRYSNLQSMVSFVLPGCKQFYSGQYIKGSLFFGGWGTSLWGVVFFNNRKNESHDKAYNTQNTQLRQTYINKREYYQYWKSLFWGITGVFYLLNLYDIKFNVNIRYSLIPILMPRVCTSKVKLVISF